MSYTSRQAAQESQQVESSANKVVSPKFTDQRASTSVQLKQQQLMQTAKSPAQLAAEEEEPLQGKFVAQRVEEEEPLQGKFVAQRAEEEELLQGKFATAQLAGMEEEEPIQGKFETLQRAAEEEEPLQGKFESSAPAQREQKPNNTGMPDNLKSGIENLSGYSMDDVKVHYNSDKPAQLNAHAYAQGTDIHVAPGQEKHLPHEAWHVVQQKQGRVQPTMQMKAGVPVNDDVGLESEADVMGAKAISQNASSKTITNEVSSNSALSTPQFYSIRKANGVTSHLPTIQCRVGNKGLANIESQIHNGSDKAKGIAKSIYDHDTKGSNEHDGNFETDTEEKIKKSALSIGYIDTYADRLAKKNPFEESDIEANTIHKAENTTTDRYESFDFQWGLGINTPPSIHRLHIDSVFTDDGVYTASYNANNPALTNFGAKKVVEVQLGMKRKKASMGSYAFNSIVRENIVSETGKIWRGTDTWFGTMTSEQLKSFLRDTVNGQMTQRTLDENKMEATDGEIIAYGTSGGWSVKINCQPKPIVI